MSKSIRYHLDNLNIVNTFSSLLHLNTESLDRIIDSLRFLKKSKTTFREVRLNGVTYQISMYMILLLLNGELINCIKYQREITGDGLYDAKKFCESLKDSLEKGEINLDVMDYIIDEVEI